MSKVNTLTNTLQGLHVMGSTGLADYHAAKACINAGRKARLIDRWTAYQDILKNYHVSIDIADGEIVVSAQVENY